jgi:hypothetical protein
MKPVSQLFELVVEKLPNFPHGRGYYEEMYNIWYNKYCETYKDEPEKIELKTEKKVKELNIPVAKPLLDIHSNIAFNMKKLNSELNTK